jgi:hypothetical protein
MVLLGIRYVEVYQDPPEITRIPLNTIRTTGEKLGERGWAEKEKISWKLF